jgi:hypothetical protein
LYNLLALHHKEEQNSKIALQPHPKKDMRTPAYRRIVQRSRHVEYIR